MKFFTKYSPALLLVALFICPVLNAFDLNLAKAGKDSANATFEERYAYIQAFEVISVEDSPCLYLVGKGVYSQNRINQLKQDLLTWRDHEICAFFKLRSIEGLGNHNVSSDFSKNWIDANKVSIDFMYSEESYAVNLLSMLSEGQASCDYVQTQSLVRMFDYISSEIDSICK